MTAPATTSRLTTTKRQTKTSDGRKFAELPSLANVLVDREKINFHLADGRIISVPLAWSEKLMQATPAQRNNVIVSDLFAFWDDIDEIIGVENVLFGNRLYK